MPAPATRPSKPRSKFRLRNRLIELRRMASVPADEYRERVRHRYDGGQGALLRLGSILSLHEPLAGRLFRTKQFDISGFRRILDVGSGAGQILRHLVAETNPDCSLIACDLSPAMLRRARQQIKSPRPHYLAADLTHLPFADESFDAITCGWVLEHFSDPRPALREMQRVLQPGGSLLLLATETSLSGAVVSRTWDCRTYERDELRESCEDAGLVWHEELWFTPLHRLLHMGGIIVELRKPQSA